MIRARRLSSLPPIDPSLRAAVGETFSRLGQARPSVTGAWEGGQSICFELQSNGVRFVLKVFSTTHDFNTAATARVEFDALQRLADALPPDGSLDAPRALDLYEANRALLMTHVEGRDVDAWMGRLLCSTATLDGLAEAIIRALRLYHDAVGSAFGDFHPGNVLVREQGGIVLLDPTSPDPLIAALAAGGESAVALDLGYWTSAVALNWPLEARTAGRHPFNRFRLTQRLISVAGRDLPAADLQALQTSTIAVGRAHVQRVYEAGTLKEKLLARVSFATLSGLGRQIKT